MGFDIDLYELKTTIKRYQDEDVSWLEFPDISIGMIEVGAKGVPKEVNEKLKAQGYSEGERALVIIQ